MRPEPVGPVSPQVPVRSEDDGAPPKSSSDAPPGTSFADPTRPTRGRRDRALTSDAAALLGLEDRGRVTAGQLADLRGVSGAPSQRAADLEQVRFVMQAGRVVVGP